MSIVVAKTILSLLFIVFTLAVYHFPDSNLVRRLLGSTKSVILFMLAFRWLPFVVIYLLLGVKAQSDVIAYFWPQAISAANGEIIYRDFVSHYSPLFPYILSLALRLWWDPRAIIILMIIIESVTLWLTYSFCHRYLTQEQSRYAALLYLALPMPFVMTVLGGQEDVWLWTAGLLVTWLLVNDKPFWAGLVGGLGFLSTKALFALPLIFYIFAVKKPLRYITGITLIGAISVLILWPLVGNKIFMPLNESTSLSPPNIWFLINALNKGRISAHIQWLSLLSMGIVTLITIVYLKLHLNKDTPLSSIYLSAWTILFCSLMFISPKSLGNYLAIFCMPLVFLLVIVQDRLSFTLLLILNFLASVQPSLWYRLGSPDHANLAFLTSVPHFVEFSMEISMLFLFVAIIFRSWMWSVLPTDIFRQTQAKYI